MEVRGLEKKFLKNLCIRTLLWSVGTEDKEGSKVLWFCTSCDAAWCAFCGNQLPVVQNKNDRNQTHLYCDGQQKFKIYKAMVELEDACKIYTEGRQVTCCFFLHLPISCPKSGQLSCQKAMICRFSAVIISKVLTTVQIFALPNSKLLQHLNLLYPTFIDILRFGRRS